MVYPFSISFSKVFFFLDSDGSIVYAVTLFSRVDVTSDIVKYFPDHLREFFLDGLSLRFILNVHDE